MNSKLAFLVLAYVGIVSSNLIDREYYVDEYLKVLDLCKQAGECKNISGLFDDNEADIDNQIEVLDKYFKIYWDNKACQKENEPCGFMWGNCCSDMECRHLNDKSITPKENFLINQNVGLCSNPKVDYSIP